MSYFSKFVTVAIFAISSCIGSLSQCQLDSKEYHAKISINNTSKSPISITENDFSLTPIDTAKPNQIVSFQKKVHEFFGPGIVFSFLIIPHDTNYIYRVLYHSSFPDKPNITIAIDVQKLIANKKQDGVSIEVFKDLEEFKKDKVLRIGAGIYLAGAMLAFIVTGLMNNK